MFFLQEKVGGPAPPGAAISNSPQTGGYQYQQSSYQNNSSYNSSYGSSGAPQQDYSAAWAQYYAQVMLSLRVLSTQQSKTRRTFTKG